MLGNKGKELKYDEVNII